MAAMVDNSGVVDEAPAAGERSGRDYAPTSELEHYRARQHRAQYQERCLQQAAATNAKRAAMHSNQHMYRHQLRAAVANAAPTANTLLLDGTERLPQVDPRRELFGEDPFAPSCFGGDRGGAASVTDGQAGRLPAQPQFETIAQGAINALEKRQANQLASREYEWQRRETLRQQHPLAAGDLPRTGLAPLNAVQAEKDTYAARYTEGNETAYAHVAAMNKSMRGYEDTSAKTLRELKAYNAREQARNGARLAM